MQYRNKKTMKLYHGTSSNFSAFELPKKAVNHEYYGEAIYFTTDYDTAKYYGDRIVEIEIEDDVVNSVVNANGKGMKHVSDVVTDLVKKGGVIAVNNVADYNFEGAQCMNFGFESVDFGEYKHLVDYRIYLSFSKKSEANRIASLINKHGARANVSKSTITGKYTVYLIGRISDDIAMDLYKNGIGVEKVMQKSAPVATTVIFAGNDALELLNSKL